MRVEAFLGMVGASQIARPGPSATVRSYDKIPCFSNADCRSGCCHPVVHTCLRHDQAEAMGSGCTGAAPAAAAAPQEASRYPRSPREGAEWAIEEENKKVEGEDSSGTSAGTIVLTLLVGAAVIGGGIYLMSRGTAARANPARRSTAFVPKYDYFSMHAWDGYDESEGDVEQGMSPYGTTSHSEGYAHRTQEWAEGAAFAWMDRHEPLNGKAYVRVTHKKDGEPNKTTAEWVAKRSGDSWSWERVWAKSNPVESTIRITQRDLYGIKILFRAPDTLALWGIPYEMRPGQQPGDLWRAAHDTDLMSRARPGYDPRKGWIWLGSPGWYGHMSDKEIALVDDFLRPLGDLVPQNPYEWSEIK